jgi:hypothetical protein
MSCQSSNGQSKNSLLFLTVNKTPSQPFTLCASQYPKVTLKFNGMRHINNQAIKHETNTSLDEAKR